MRQKYCITSHHIFSQNLGYCLKMWERRTSNKSAVQSHMKSTISIPYSQGVATDFYTRCNPKGICVFSWAQTRDLLLVRHTCKSLHYGNQVILKGSCGKFSPVWWILYGMTMFFLQCKQNNAAFVFLLWGPLLYRTNTLYAMFRSRKTPYLGEQCHAYGTSELLWLAGRCSCALFHSAHRLVTPRAVRAYSKREREKDTVEEIKAELFIIMRDLGV